MVLWLIVSGIRSASNAISKALKGDDSQKPIESSGGWQKPQAVEKSQQKSKWG